MTTLAALLVAHPAAARDLLVWNTTSRELTEISLAPAGSTAFGTNQTANDPDHAVSADERLRLTGVQPGRYDVRVTDRAGHRCVVHDVELRGTGKVAFALAERDLESCR